MPLKVGGRRPPASSAASEMLYGKLVELVGRLDLGQRMEFANALGDGAAFDDLSPELVDLVEELATWATRRLVR